MIVTSVVPIGRIEPLGGLYCSVARSPQKPLSVGAGKLTTLPSPHDCKTRSGDSTVETAGGSKANSENRMVAEPFESVAPTPNPTNSWPGSGDGEVSVCERSVQAAPSGLA